jgi:hypothetical protein
MEETLHCPVARGRWTKKIDRQKIGWNFVSLLLYGCRYRYRYALRVTSWSSAGYLKMGCSEDEEPNIKQYIM